MRLSDDLSGPDWQRVRNAQLRGDSGPVPIDSALSDDMAPDVWHLVRAQQAAGATSAEASTVIVPQYDVDSGFLAEKEGAHRDMKVPNNKGQVIGHSGPTIGMGVDLGQRNAADLRALHLDPDLESRLTPYLGKRGDEALKYVQANPLVLSESEFDALNKAVLNHELPKLVGRFNAASQVGSGSSRRRRRPRSRASTTSTGRVRRRRPRPSTGARSPRGIGKAPIAIFSTSATRTILDARTSPSCFSTTTSRESCRRRVGRVYR